MDENLAFVVPVLRKGREGRATLFVDDVSGFKRLGLAESSLAFPYGFTVSVMEAELPEIFESP